MRVMIVDDQPRMRAVIRDVLAPSVAEISECSSAAEALERYPVFHPDWITMDYRMEPVDGISATLQLRSRYPEARVIIVTYYDEPELRAAAQEAGAHGFLLKENLASLPGLLGGMTAASGFTDVP